MLVLLAAAAVGVSGCAPSGDTRGGSQSTVLVTSTTFVHANELPPAEPEPEPDLPKNGSVQMLVDAAVSAATSRHPGMLGVATATADGVLSSGFHEPSPAWSTIKVPIAIAALRVDPSLYPDATAAITASDNDAAQRLYAQAGADAVNAVLSEMGLATAVNTAPIRPEFSTFGQTLLSVSDEAAMAGQLACVVGAAPVVALMGQVDPVQAYGLGAVGAGDGAEAAFKGGWGPDPTGSYHVRQFGLVPRGDGSVAAVALTAVPADGTYQTGQAMLTTAADVLARQAGVLPAAPCQP